MFRGVPRPFDGPADAFVCPNWWTGLCADDQREFLRLRGSFREEVPAHARDRRSASFSQELVALLQFIERSPIGFEERSLLVGVAFAGPFICVNTRQLKALVGRCKSSINGSFQQLGYVGIKSKACDCLLSVLPSLVKQPTLLRQWTVRCASEHSQVCFVTKFRKSPFGIDELLQAPPKPPPAEPLGTGVTMPVPILGPAKVKFDLPAEEPFARIDERPEFWDMGIGEPFADRFWDTAVIPRSQSSAPPASQDWYLSDNQ
jgi:hypothetical protein